MKRFLACLIAVLCIMGFSVAPVMAGDCSVTVSFNKDGISIADLNLTKDITIGLYKIGNYSEGTGFTVDTALNSYLTPADLGTGTIDDGKLDALETAVMDQGYTLAGSGVVNVSDGKASITGLDQGLYLGRLEDGPSEFGMKPFLVTLITSVEVQPKWELVTQAKVEKVWDDAHNQDGKRPSSIEVTLYRYPSGKPEQIAEVKKVSLTGNGDTWSHTEPDLPKYDTIKTRSILWVYTWDEENVPADYVKTSVGNDEEDVADDEAAAGGSSSNVWKTTITNTHEPEKTERVFEKVWDDENNKDGKRPATLKVTLSADRGAYSTTPEEFTLPADDGSWTITKTGLDKYFEGQEIQYLWNEEIINNYSLVKREEADIKNDEGEVIGKKMTFTNKQVEVTIPVQKIWDDANNQDGYRPPSIKVSLYRNPGDNEEKVDEATLDDTNEWGYISKELPKYADDAHTVLNVYEWREEPFDNDDKYGAPNAPDTTGAIQVITNPHTPETVDLKVWKDWDDDENAAALRPDSIVMTLSADDETTEYTLTEQGMSYDCATGETTPLEDQPWYYELLNLPKFKDGKEINYTWTEVTSVEGYDQTKPEVDAIYPAEYRVTNSIKRGSLRISKNVTVNGQPIPENDLTIADGTYVFNITGGPDTKPDWYSGSVSITILNGQMVGDPVEVSNLLPGKYTVIEDPDASTYNLKGVAPWELIVQDATTNVVLEDDEGNLEGLTVEVQAGEEAQIQTAAFTNNFGNDQYGAVGSLTIRKNVTVNGKEPSATEADGTFAFKITGPRDYSETVTIEIKNGASNTVTLDRLHAGKYTVTEVPTAGFSISKREGGTLLGDNSIVVDVSTDEAAVVPTAAFTNNMTKTPETTTISGTKTWDDNSDEHKVRPEAKDFTITLYANKKATDYKPTWTDTKKDTWKYTFKDIPVRDENGEVIAYTVEEKAVDHYKLVNVNVKDGNSTDSDAEAAATTEEANAGKKQDTNPYNLTNEYVEGTKKYTNISGTKTWADSGNQGKTRPNSITVTLYQEMFDKDGNSLGEAEVYKDDKGVAAERTVTAATGWKYNFQNIPVTDGAGNTYKYTVRETGADGYTQTLSGYNIKNTPKPVTTRTSGGGGSVGGSLKSRTQEQLEDLVDVLDYDTPLYGGLLGTGDRTPIYPFIFAGVGAAALIILLVFGRKRKQNGKDS